MEIRMKHLFPIAVLSIIIFIALSGTVFYEEPSCVTSDVDFFDGIRLIPIATASVMISMVVVITGYEGYKLWRRKDEREET